MRNWVCSQAYPWSVGCFLLRHIIKALEYHVVGAPAWPSGRDCNAGSKEGVVKAFSEGIIDAVGAKSAVVRQHVSDLRHWLQTDALYGVQHVKVTAKT